MPIRLPFRFRQALSLGHPLPFPPRLAARHLSGSPTSLAQRAGKAKSSGQTSKSPAQTADKSAQKPNKPTPLSEAPTASMSGRYRAPPKRRPQPQQQRGPPPLPGGLFDQAAILSRHPIQVPSKYTHLPKDVLNQYIAKRGGKLATYKVTQGEANGKIYYRYILTLILPHHTELL